MEAAAVSYPGFERDLALADSAVEPVRWLGWPDARPGREQEQQASVLGGAHLAALVGVEHGQQTRRRRWRPSPSGPEISIAPETTSIHARSWTWCS